MDQTEQLLAEAPNDFKWKSKIASKYIVLIESQLLNRAYEKAVTAAQNGLKWEKQRKISILLALSFLHQGKFKDAKRISLEFKEESCERKACGKELLDRLAHFENEGIVHKDAKKLRKLLD